MPEAWLVYHPRRNQLYYQLDNKAYDATTLREISNPFEFGIPILRIQGNQNWPEPVFIRTTNGWSIEGSQGRQFVVLAQSSPQVIEQPVLDFKLFKIPKLTHANLHADGTESLEPIAFTQEFNPQLIKVLEYLRNNRLPMIFDVRQRSAIL